MIYFLNPLEISSRKRCLFDEDLLNDNDLVAAKKSRKRIATWNGTVDVLTVESITDEMLENVCDFVSEKIYNAVSFRCFLTTEFIILNGKIDLSRKEGPRVTSADRRHWIWRLCAGALSLTTYQTKTSSCSEIFCFIEVVDAAEFGVRFVECVSATVTPKMHASLYWIPPGSVPPAVESATAPFAATAWGSVPLGLWQK